MAPALALALLSVLSLANACSVNKGGCSPKVCAALNKVKAGKIGAGPLFGFYYGVWNKDLDKGLEKKPHKQGGPVVNYEAFTEVGDIQKYGSATTLGGCCSECAKTAGCVVYQFFEKNDLKKKGRSPPPGFKDGVQCYLLKGGKDKVDLPGYGVPHSGPRSDQEDNEKKLVSSWVGGQCNPDAMVVDDPHFTGALGTSFDFNGELNKPFCLVTDKDFHINVMLKGYNDDTAEKGLRSWIKEVGLLWTANGKSHSAHLVARNSKDSARGDGFMSRLALDNEVVAVPAQEGEEVTADGFTLRFVGIEKMGPYDVELYSANVAGVAKLNLRMRVAHKKLQTADDAEAHFNIEVVELKQTPKIHGVLGQTFRGTDEQVKKALKYSELANLLHAPVRADGATGQGFLDGSVGDYESSSVLAPDCRFTSYSTL